MEESIVVSYLFFLIKKLEFGVTNYNFLNNRSLFYELPEIWCEKKMWIEVISKMLISKTAVRQCVIEQLFLSLLHIIKFKCVYLFLFVWKKVKIHNWKINYLRNFILIEIKYLILQEKKLRNVWYLILYFAKSNP